MDNRVIKRSEENKLLQIDDKEQEKNSFLTEISTLLQGKTVNQIEIVIEHIKVNIIPKCVAP